MIRTRILIGLTSSLLIATGTAIVSKAASTQESTPTTPTDPLTRRGKMDPRHPRFADDYELQVGEKFSPDANRAKHQRGYCVVHTTVGSSGAALNATVTHSTGSAILDKACVAAVTAARFAPELQNGTPVADSTDIAIYW